MGRISLLIYLALLLLLACVMPTSNNKMSSSMHITQDLNRLPQFTITAIEPQDSSRYIGIFDSEIRLGNGWISYLVSQNGLCIEGRFYQFDINTKRAVFKPKDSNQIGLLETGKTYAYLDGYWGELVALVLDASRHWKRELFIPQDAVEYRSGDKRILGRIGQAPDFPVDGEGQLLKNGWDHEHCAICQATISEDEQRYGYKDQNDEWVCESCYADFVQPRKLGFLNDTALSQIRRK